MGGKLLFRQNKIDEAISALRKAIELQPNDYLAYDHLAVILEKQGSLEEALTANQKAAEINPEDAVAYYNMGSVLSKQSRFEEAAHACQQALARDPKNLYAHNHVYTWNNLGEIYHTQGKKDEAILAYQKQLKLDLLTLLYS